ncbi:MAG: guanylate kinase, partial [Phycisphaerae bacterium]|nr:guanylate kinase [Phycisphaerae bacterium]NIP51971.1 guanylate kinase [Phycisphaerae bacterium]NIU08724.1 guanylate kinase [Phycisphaerae bacterium]NIW98326.1 guanylate kinase [Phycisphaerae bacterium]NIX27963.1 guanylate kinase [Phycisphaerae bacterium]
FGQYYGTSRHSIEQRLQQGVDVILEIDWQGARQVRQKMPDARSIFILPPSRQVLHERLINRGQDNAEIIARRTRAAAAEMSHYTEFDYLIFNDEFSESLAALQAIIKA